MGMFENKGEVRYPDILLATNRLVLRAVEMIAKFSSCILSSSHSVDILRSILI